MDTTADEAGDLSVTVDSVINNEELDDVTLTLSGVDADADSVVVTVTDSNGTSVTEASDGRVTLIHESKAGDQFFSHLPSYIENVTTGAGDDIIQGSDVSNVITAGAGDDWLYAGSGDDVLIGGEGTDRLFGGEGNDTVLYDTDEDLSINLNSYQGWQFANGSTSVGTDKLEGIENITTGSGDDTLVGDANANVLTGGSGDDTLTGGAGDDVFRFYSL